jgi:hypothetical protein
LLFSAATYLNEFVLYFVVLCCHIFEWICTILCCSRLPPTWMSLYHTLLFSAATYYKLIQVCGSREQQSTVQTHSSMWQQRTTKYSTNSFKYVAAENNKVWYKLCTVLCCSLLPHTWMSLYCTLLFSAATYLNEFVLYFIILCCHILEMWQQRTIKYSTNSFRYVAAENNKVWYKLIQVCGSREQQSTVQTHSSMW